MDDPARPLDTYLNERDPAAFGEWARRHLDLVYSAARRHARGDPHQAQEITQMVFLTALRKAALLARHPAPLAWLHQTTRHAASELRRAEARRLARETRAATDPALAPDVNSAEAPADWSRVEPLLDEALATLGERDREAVLLRYFANQPYATIGQRLGLAENTARVRTDRALEKLRRALAARGVTSTASALGLALGANAVTAAPASVATATLAALATASPVGAGSTTTLLVMTTSQKALVSLAVLLLALWLGRTVFLAPSAPLASAQTKDAGSVPLASPTGGTLSPAPVDTPAARAVALFSSVPRFATLAELEAAMFAVLKEEDPAKRRALLAAMGIVIVSKELDEGVDGWKRARWGGSNAALTLTDLAHNAQTFFAPLLELWAQEAPDAALAWLLVQPVATDGALHRVFDLVASLHSEGAGDPALGAALLAHSPRPEEAMEVRALAAALADPARFLGDTSGLALDERRVRAAISRLDPSDALRIALGARSPSVLQSALLKVGASSDEVKIIRDVLTAAGSTVSPAQRNLLLALAADSSADFGAARVAVSGDTLGELQEWLDVSWARVAPEAAVRDVLARPAGDRSAGTLFSMLCDGIASAIDPTDFARWIADAPPSRQADAWGKFYLAQSYSDPARALAGLRAVPGLSDTANVEGRILLDWTRRDAAGALEWMAHEPTANGRLIEQTAHALAAQDPQSALLLVRSTNLPLTRDLAVSLADSLVLDQGATAADSFLTTLSDPAVHDAALGASLVRSLSQDWPAIEARLETQARGDVAAAKFHALSLARQRSGDTRSLLAARDAFDSIPVTPAAMESAKQAAVQISLGLLYAPGQGLAPTLRWAQRLPPPVALAVGEHAVTRYIDPASVEQPDPQGREQLLAWLDKAPISAAERSRLKARLVDASSPAK